MKDKKSVTVIPVTIESRDAGGSHQGEVSGLKEGNLDDFTLQCYSDSECTSRKKHHHHNERRKDKKKWKKALKRKCKHLHPPFLPEGLMSAGQPDSGLRGHVHRPFIRPPFCGHNFNGLISRSNFKKAHHQHHHHHHQQQQHENHRHHRDHQHGSNVDETGQKFKTVFSVNLEHFRPEDICVTLMNTTLTVNAKHGAREDEVGYPAREVTIKYDVSFMYYDDINTVLYDDGILEINLPDRIGQDDVTVVRSASEPKEEITTETQDPAE